MSRARRHALIKQMLRDAAATTQEELVEKLRDAGISVTQATVSRDLSAIGAVRGPDGYRLPEQFDPGAVTTPDRGRLRTVLREHALRVLPASSIVVIHTAPGHANFVASELDAAPPEGVVGTIAGDDTIFLATESDTQAKALARELDELIGGDA